MSSGVGDDPLGPVGDPAPEPGLEAALESIPEAGEGQVEVTLRPRSLAEFIGQPQLKEHLAIVLEAARRRGQPPDHLLFAGPPGLGKTSLAGIVALELGAQLTVTSGPALERAGDLAAMLTNVNEGDVLFIDEIHRLPRPVEEVLYAAMEDFQIDIVIGKGPGARSVRLDLPRFTLIGATTRAGMITGPLRDRFGHVARLDYYGVSDLQQVVLRSARILGVRIVEQGAHEIARRSRGTPRIANRLLRRIRDYAEVRAEGVIDLAAASAGLDVFEVDGLGLDRVDRAILSAVCTRFGGGPVGLSTLAISVAEDPDTLEAMYEPFLLQMGLLKRTPKGRIAMPAAWEHLGVPIPDAALRLFGEGDPEPPANGDRTLFD